ncbi:CyP450 monooxygenase [Punctularia strigosozonata HHB-11173 SS5]|uniref:CyP450 monooxygenase n=1 Tax=Punctularia strigosozonata (strain HHB-11173) TaxID=741275 RepID=R7S2P3_PUNST|nr:CyP450 monooxygenase [Punctularia strigosozonata HHB-11173 SS5]EIN04655.1 CyP450 monooxygenase [Punctularia strigosozonata HHB-11173 SS5]
MELVTLFAVLLAIVTASLLVHRRHSSKYSGLPLPPSPSASIPWIRHAFQIPTERPWLTYKSWSDIYGDILSFEAFGKRYVILGSLKATMDLLERRSSNYSDRPEVPMLNDLSGWDFQFGFQKYGTRWRTERRLFHQFMNVNQVAQYRPKQLQHARALANHLLEHPDQWQGHCRLMLGVTIMDALYGIQVTERDDKYIRKAEVAFEAFNESAQPTAYLVNTFPWLKYVPSWFPGAHFKRQAAAWKKVVDEFVNWPFQHVKEATRNGSSRPCVALSLLDKVADQPEVDIQTQETTIKNCCMIESQSSSCFHKTVSALSTFFLAMAMHPEIVRIAWKELDSVLDGQRLPAFNDQERLPYITAICKEVMRWQTPSPLAAVHSSIADDVYEGYFLPKGTMFFGNAWAILHDPEVYPEPHEFKPERFLKDGKLDPTIQDPNVAAFGFGRRICPGRWFSGQALFITVATVLAVFDIKAPVDEAGHPKKLKASMTTGVISYPEPFECDVVPRSESAKKLIREGINDTD